MSEKLSKEQIAQMEHLLSTPPTVNVEVNMRGELWIDGARICRDFNKLMGSEGMALKIEVAILRAISSAEERAVERFKEHLAKLGVKIPQSKELFPREKL